MSAGGMNWHILHGGTGAGRKPNEENPLSHFSTDMRWEIGYDPKWFTFWARLLDEDPDEDPDEDLTPAEKASPVFEVGDGPEECPDLVALNRELSAMSMSIPADVAAALKEDQRRHLAGEFGESPEVVAERRRIVRALAFHEHLLDVHSLVGRPRQ